MEKDPKPDCVVAALAAEKGLGFRFDLNEDAWPNVDVATGAADWPNIEGFPRALAEPNDGADVLPKAGAPNVDAGAPEAEFVPKPVVVHDDFADVMGEEVPNALLEVVPKPD